MAQPMMHKDLLESLGAGVLEPCLWRYRLENHRQFRPARGPDEKYQNWDRNLPPRLTSTPCREMVLQKLQTYFWGTLVKDDHISVSSQRENGPEKMELKHSYKNDFQKNCLLEYEKNSRFSAAERAACLEFLRAKSLERRSAEGIARKRYARSSGRRFPHCFPCSADPAKAAQPSLPARRAIREERRVPRENRDPRGDCTPLWTRGFHLCSPASHCGQ